MVEIEKLALIQILCINTCGKILEIPLVWFNRFESNSIRDQFGTDLNLYHSTREGVPKVSLKHIYSFKMIIRYIDIMEEEVVWANVCEWYCLQ